MATWWRTNLTHWQLRCWGESEEHGSSGEGTPVQGMENLTDLRELISGPHWCVVGTVGTFQELVLSCSFYGSPCAPTKGPGRGSKVCVALSCTLGNYKTEIKTPWSFAVGEGCHLLPEGGLTADIWKGRLLPGGESLFCDFKPKLYPVAKPWKLLLYPHSLRWDYVFLQWLWYKLGKKI